MTRSAQGSIATIDQFISQVGQVKTASEKAADGSTPLSEPGSIGGETSHPVKKVDDRLQAAKEGERSAENSKDVKKDQGAPSVENAAEASTKNAAARSIFGVAAGFAKKAEGAVSTPGSAADDHISTTTKVAPTGEDPSNETGKAKAGKEDKEQGGVGGTSHPASTENDQLDGHKYAADTPLEKLANDMRTSGNNLLAALHNLYNSSGVQAPQQTKQAAAQNPVPQQPQQIDPRLAYHAGAELAGLINGTMDKRAADKLVHDTLTDVIKQASDDADLFITYASGFFKRAEGEDEGATDPTAGGGGDAAAAPAPGGAGGGGGGEEDMMAALGGGAGGDPMAGAGGGDPMAGGGGGGGEDHEAAQLALILEQLGVTPEELQQAMAEQGMGGGDPMAGGGGGDPMASLGGGGAPPGGGMGGGAPPGGMETQANAGGGKRNVQTKVAQAEVAGYIREIVSRSRAKR